MSDYTENVRIHTIEVMWSPSKVSDVTINHLIVQHEDEIMSSLISLGAKDVSVSGGLSVGLPEEETWEGKDRGCGPEATDIEAMMALHTATRDEAGVTLSGGECLDILKYLKEQGMILTWEKK